MQGRLRRLMRPLAGTPLHPQWLLGQRMRILGDRLRALANDSTVLDIGCADRWPAACLPTGCSYIGLDYPVTAINWYNTRPDVFGDAGALPIEAASVDVVLLLDVLEHLPDADTALHEIRRVLRPGGTVLLQVPFLYPLHDEPRDFQRLTRHGFTELARRHDLELSECLPLGQPAETAALLANIATGKTLLNWLRTANPAALLVVLAPLAILLNNLLARVAAMLGPRDDFMPYAYQLVLRKPARPEKHHVPDSQD